MPRGDQAPDPEPPGCNRGDLVLPDLEILLLMTCRNEMYTSLPEVNSKNKS